MHDGQLVILNTTYSGRSALKPGMIGQVSGRVPDHDGKITVKWTKYVGGPFVHSMNPNDLIPIHAG